MIPRTLHESFLAGLIHDDEWRKGRLCRRARQAYSELIDRDEDDIASVEYQVNSVVDLLESPIEQVAAYHLLGRNYAPFTTDRTIFARMYDRLPEIWPEGVIIAIVPQVDIGRYRVDFMVHLRNGARFAIECDGEKFHSGSADCWRDAALDRHFNLLTVRIKGSAIWESPLWTNEIRRTVFMLLGIRNAERMPTNG